MFILTEVQKLVPNSGATIVVSLKVSMGIKCGSEDTFKTPSVSIAT